MDQPPPDVIVLYVISPFLVMSLYKLVPATPDITRFCAFIAVRDSHPFCLVCTGLKYTQEAIDFSVNCSHCLALPARLRHRRLK